MIRTLVILGLVFAVGFTFGVIWTDNDWQNELRRQGVEVIIK